MRYRTTSTSFFGALLIITIVIISQYIYIYTSPSFFLLVPYRHMSRELKKPRKAPQKLSRGRSGPEKLGKTSQRNESSWGALKWMFIQVFCLTKNRNFDKIGPQELSRGRPGPETPGKTSQHNESSWGALKCMFMQVFCLTKNRKFDENCGSKKDVNFFC